MCNDGTAEPNGLRHDELAGYGAFPFANWCLRHAGRND